MSFVTLAIVNSVLTSIEAALQDGVEVDHGVLGSFNAGISHLLLSGREPSAVEVAALQSLAAAIVVTPESDAEEGVAPPAPTSEPSSGGGENASPPGDTALDAGASEPASGAAGDAEASRASVTPGSDEAQPQSEPAAAVQQQSGLTAGDELFQEQPHDEDDGA